jgi:tRNA threonylcarbamoyladenosine biosynthesis protein TsaB
MTGVLAIETATDACSVALYRDRQFTVRHKVAPRRHNQLLFTMLSELLADGDLPGQGIEAIAYGCGPGSFTGLRIAASAVQGLAYATGLPAVPVSTLACQAYTAARRLDFSGGDTILSVLDAKINEVYYAIYRLDEERLVEAQPPRVSAPEEMRVDTGSVSHAIGSGCRYAQSFPVQLRSALISVHDDVLPEARDLIPPALDKLRAGETQSPAEVQPVYVRDEISWKKLPQQGKGR